MPWKPKPLGDVDESTRLHVFRIQTNDTWVGWTEDGTVEYSEGYEPSSETRLLFSVLGPLIKQHVKRKAPKPKSRRSRWNSSVERKLLEKQGEDDI